MSRVTTSRVAHQQLEQHLLFRRQIHDVLADSRRALDSVELEIAT